MKNSNFILFVIAISLVAVLSSRTPQISQDLTSGSGETVGAVSNYPKGVLPDPKLTPGAINPNINQNNVSQNICNPNWTTKSIRPPVSYTNKLKAQQIKEYGYTDTNMADYEEDHLISLEVGGSPTDPKNLWPEAYDNGNYGARIKDQTENQCHKLVCSGKITLAEAQKEISSNWITACKQ